MKGHDHMRMKELTNEEFRQFSDSFYLSSIYQTPEYAFVMNGQNNTSMLIGYLDGNTIVGATMIYIRKVNGFKYAYAPRGFLLDYNDETLVYNFTKDIKKFLSGKGVMAIKLCPLIPKCIYDPKNKTKDNNLNYDHIFQILKQNKYFHMGYNNYFEALKPRFVASIDMSNPYYMIFNNFKKEVRTKIRSAADKGIHVYKGTEQNLEYIYLQTKENYPRNFQYFKDCYEAFGRNNMIDYYYTKLNTEQYLKRTKRKYEALETKTNEINRKISESNTKNHEKLLGQKMKLDLEFSNIKSQLIEATNLLGIYPDGVVTATMMVARHQDEITVLIDGYDKNFKSFNSKHLLIWKLVERYSKMGYRKFNLGGITSINVGKNPYSGLNNFKLGFNPKVYEYMGDLELKTNEIKYFTYQNTVPIRRILGGKK